MNEHQLERIDKLRKQAYSEAERLNLPRLLRDLLSGEEEMNILELGLNISSRDSFTSKNKFLTVKYDDFILYREDSFRCDFRPGDWVDAITKYHLLEEERRRIEQEAEDNRQFEEALSLFEPFDLPHPADLADLVPLEEVEELHEPPPAIK